MTGPSINLALLLSTAAAQRRLQQDMTAAAQRAGAASSNAFEASFRPKNIANAILPFAATALAERGFATIIKSAQQYEAALNATVQVYGEASKEINVFVETQSRGLGLAKKDAQDYANQFGAILIGLGGGQKEAAKYAKALTEAGGALAAFRNTSTEQAIRALQAGFRGEYDSLQRFIPEVSDLTLRNKALALGLAETRTQVTQQDKAMALLDIVQNSVARSAGQAELEQGNLQTRLAETKAQSIDTAAAIGRVLLPALSGTLDVVNAVGPGFVLAGAGALLLGRRMQTASAAGTGFIAQSRGAFSATTALNAALLRQQTQLSGLTVTQAIAARGAIVANNAIIGTTTATLASTGPLARFTGQLIAAGSAGTLAARGVAVAGVAIRGVGAAATAGLAALGGPLTIALVGATLGVGYFLTQQAKQREESKRAAAANKSYAESIVEVGDKSSASARKLAAQEVVQRGLAAQADRNMISVELLTTAYTGQQDAIELVNKRISDRIERLRAERAAIVDAEGPSSARAVQIKEEITDLTDLQGKVNGNAEALRAATQKTDLFGKAMGTASDGIGLVANAYDRAQKALTDYQEAEDILLAGRQEALDANIAYEAAIDEITAAIEKNGTTLDVTTAKGRDNVANVRDLIQAAYDQAAADIEMTGSVSANTQKRIDNLKAELTSMGFTKQEVENLIAAYKRVPPEVVTQIKVLGGADANNELNNIGKAALEMIAKYNLTPVQAMGLVQGRDPRAVFGSPDSARGRAMGGRIIGPGGPTEDKAGLYRLSNNEVVLKAASVQRLEQKYGKRAPEYLNEHGDIPAVPIGAFAVGGRVTHNAQPKTWPSWGSLLDKSKQLFSARKKELDAAQAAAAGGGHWDGTVQPGALGRAQQWILSQAGGRYLWAGVGNKASDCSGFVGNAWAALTGNPLYRRYFTTHNMGPGRFGMQPGRGNVTVYLKQGGGGGGHTAINAGGLHGEAYGGNGTPFAIGRVGTRLSYYDQVLHMPGFAKGGRVRNASDPGSTEKDRVASFFERGWPEPPTKVIRQDSDLSRVYSMDRGGVLNPKDIGINFGNRPEKIMNADQSERFDALTNGRTAFHLSDMSIAKIIQGLQLRPAIIQLDGREIARAVFDRGSI